MRLTLTLAPAFLAGLCLSACDSAGDEAVPAGAVSEGEAAALDEAAKMLDEQRLPEGVLPDLDPPAPDAQQEPTQNPQE